MALLGLSPPYTYLPASLKRARRLLPGQRSNWSDKRPAKRAIPLLALALMGIDSHYLSRHQDALAF